MPKPSLRDLFAVVTIVALALGWWLDRSRLAQSRELFYEHYRTNKSEVTRLGKLLENTGFDREKQMVEKENEQLSERWPSVNLLSSRKTQEAASKALRVKNEEIKKSRNQPSPAN